MAAEKPIPSKVDSTPIEVKYEDMPEERRKQFEAQLKKEQEEAMRGFLACYGKTRQGIVEKEKFAMPTFTPPNPSTSSTSGTSNVSFTTDSIKQFIDAFCSRFEESHKLTQDLLIDMNLQLNGNRAKSAANGYSNEIPNASDSAAQTNIPQVWYAAELLHGAITTTRRSSAHNGRTG